MVGETICSIDYNSLFEKLSKICYGVCDVRNLGACKALITFTFKEDKDKIMEEK